MAKGGRNVRRRRLRATGGGPTPDAGPADQPGPRPDAAGGSAPTAPPTIAPPTIAGVLEAALWGLVTAGSLWVGRVKGALLEQVDPASGTVVRRLQTRVGVALAFAAGRLWTVFRDGRLQRLATE